MTFLNVLRAKHSKGIHSRPSFQRRSKEEIRDETAANGPADIDNRFEANLWSAHRPDTPQVLSARASNAIRIAQEISDRQSQLHRPQGFARATSSTIRTAMTKKRIA